MDADEEEELAGALDETTAHSRAQSTLKKHKNVLARCAKFVGRLNPNMLNANADGLDYDLISYRVIMLYLQSRKLHPIKSDTPRNDKGEAIPQIKSLDTIRGEIAGIKYGFQHAFLAEEITEEKKT